MSNWWFSHISIATHVTLLRVLLVPLIITSMLAQAWLMTFLLFILAAVTDVIDGYLARYLQQETLLGSIIDSSADKVLLLSVYIGLLVSVALPSWFVVFITVNELILVGASAYGVFLTNTVVVKPTQLGRMTSMAQILFLGWFFLAQAYGPISPGLVTLFLGLIVCARLCSMGQYITILWRQKWVSL